MKFTEDRDALREAVSESGQTRFFAGTDSAPHTTKATECGCAAGCFTGNCAPQLYAMAFEAAGLALDTDAGQRSFENFLCLNGPAFYRLPTATERFAMIRTPATMSPLETPAGPVIPLPLGMNLELAWSLTNV